MNELATFATFLRELLPTLVDLFKWSKGDSKAAIRVVKAGYQKVSAEQDAELARQRARTKAKGRP